MKPMGLLALLDEESHFPKATDASLVGKKNISDWFGNLFSVFVQSENSIPKFKSSMNSRKMLTNNENLHILKLWHKLSMMKYSFWHIVTSVNFSEDPETNNQPWNFKFEKKIIRFCIN